MPSAKLTLPNGTTVSVEGTAEEVARLLKLFSGSEASSIKDVADRRGGTEKGGSANKARGPSGYIRQLKTDGFFKGKRSLSDIQEKLEEMGHIYAVTGLSPTLVRLVRAGVLGRVKEDGVWKYVNR